MSGLSLIEHFSALEDPRQSWKVLFPLPEILLLVVCGTLARAGDFVEIRRWRTRSLQPLAGTVSAGFIRNSKCAKP